MKSPFPSSLAGAALSVLFGASAFAADDYFPPPDSEGGWRTLKTAGEIRAKAGMDLPTLDAAYNITERSTGNGGLLVVRHGYLVYEKYFGRAQPQRESRHGLHRQGVHEHCLRDHAQGVSR